MSKVHEAITAVMADLAVAGIGKDRKNQAQGYAFRGIDDVYNALAPIMSKHKLMCLPRCLSRTVSERETAKGGTLFYVVVDVEYDLTADDGSVHVVRVPGEAMDSGDKATNKAMSAAFKYMAMQVFCIPTEGDNDADAQTHEVKPRAAAPMSPNQFADHCTAMQDAADEEGLKLAFSKAYKAAQALGDTQAMKSFEEKKDQLKTTIAKPA